jgi:hypothetical protein
MYLRKNLQLSEVCLKMAGDDAWTFEGYASVFGGVDAHQDTIVAGAYDYTLRTNGQPKLYLEHIWANPFVGGSQALPIGKCSCKEDDHGLYLRGELTQGMSVSTDVRAAMKHGTIDGLSVGGFVKKGDYDETESGRVIRRWTKLIEVSVVAMPADGKARIDTGTVKHATDLAEAIADIESIRDLERFLRDAGNFSKGASTALVARVKQVLGVVGDPAPAGLEAKQLQQLQERLTRMGQSIQP